MDPAAYIKERVDVRRMELAKNIRSNLLGRLVYEIQKSFASLMADLSTRPGHQPGLPPEVDAAARGILQPGDVLLTRKEHVFTNYFLPGFWPHGALNLGTHDELVSLGLRERKHFSSYEAQIQELQLNDPSRSIEALKDGVHLRTLASPLGADSVVILRPKLASDQLADALDRVLQHTDKPYDFDFDFTRADRMVCTEVIYRAYDGIADLRFKLARRAGRMTLSAMDIIHMALAGKHFSIVATHIPSASQDLLTGDTAQQAVRNLA